MVEITCLAFKDVPWKEIGNFNTVEQRAGNDRTESYRAAGDEKVMTVQKKLRSRQ
jgi:hypothetical protein